MLSLGSAVYCKTIKSLSLAYMVSETLSQKPKLCEQSAAL